MRKPARLALAFERLLSRAEEPGLRRDDSVLVFILTVSDWQSATLDISMLRRADIPVADDMLVCLEALRWIKGDLCDVVGDGRRRVHALRERANMDPSGKPGLNPPWACP